MMSAWLRGPSGMQLCAGAKWMRSEIHATTRIDSMQTSKLKAELGHIFDFDAASMQGRFAKTGAHGREDEVRVARHRALGDCGRAKGPCPFMVIIAVNLFR